MRWALVENGKVVNVVVADGDYQAPTGVTAVDATDSRVGPGWTYDGNAFAPPPEPEPTPTLEEAQADKANGIDAAYLACLRRGVTWNGTNWTATDSSRDTLYELIEVAEASGQAVAILDADNSRHDLPLAGRQVATRAGS